jgi:hypothetical protein
MSSTRVFTPRLYTQLFRPWTPIAYKNLTRHITPALLTTTSPFLNNANATMDKDQSRGESTTGISEWKQRAPYKVHESNEKFNALYEANCHCGKVKYQLSRQEPLDSKLCHCTTCQTQHGT